MQGNSAISVPLSDLGESPIEVPACAPNPTQPETLALQASPKSNNQQVWDACVDLSNQERHITRKVLAELTGLKMQIVDDHVERLITYGRLRRVGYGVLEIVEQFPPPRPISKTVMPNGVVKIEIGDQCLDLTPKEARTIGEMFCAEVIAARDLNAEDRALVRMQELSLQLGSLQKLGTTVLGQIKTRVKRGNGVAPAALSSDPETSER